MRPLRFPRFWLIGGYLLVLATIAGSLSAGFDRAPVDTNDKLLHAAVYLILMLWFSGIYQRTHYLRVALALFVLGIALELVQGQLAHRAAEMGDLYANTIGIAAGALLALAGLGNWCGQLETRIALGR